MKTTQAKSVLKELLSPAGIELTGEKPWDIRVRDERFYRRVLCDGSLGLGESYMDGWWECDDLPEFFRRLIPSDPEARLKKNWKLLLYSFKSIALNPGRKCRAYEIAREHYDIGNDLYQCMLDRRMIYSCAYWKDAGNLNEAQEAKLDLICRKLRLKPGQRILDIGCGWGGLLRYAAEKCGVEAVGITVSREQATLAMEMCASLPIEIRLQDYREVRGCFDHIVSVGMFEHVGYRNYRLYMDVARRNLKEGGLFLLHTIGNNLSCVVGDLWIEKYIFPNSLVPSMKQISGATEGLFIIEDVQNLGAHYDRTLSAWFGNFDMNWEKLKNKYGERFYRMWKYYLQLFTGAFRARHLQVWQIVLSRDGVPGGYRPVR